MKDMHIVAVHLRATGGGMRWYRSVPRSHSEAMAESAEFAREGYETRVEKATANLVDAGKRAARLKRAKARTRQLDLFGAA